MSHAASSSDARRSDHLLLRRRTLPQDPFRRLRLLRFCYPSRVKPSSAALALILFPLLACRTQTTANPATNSNAETRQSRAAAKFDFYLLNLSWSPEYCHSHPSAAECAAHAAFVLHGLWPENSDGSYPENCSSAPGPSDPTRYQDLYPDPGLLQHEWKTHGTCSGLSPDDYFNAAGTAFRSVRIPSQLSGLSAQISLPPDADPRTLHDSQPADPRIEPGPHLRQQLPHGGRGLPGQVPPPHLLHRPPFLPRQHGPHPATVTGSSQDSG